MNGGVTWRRITNGETAKQNNDQELEQEQEQESKKNRNSKNTKGIFNYEQQQENEVGPKQMLQSPSKANKLNLPLVNQPWTVLGDRRREGALNDKRNKTRKMSEKIVGA